MLSNFVFDWMIFSNPHTHPELGVIFGMTYKRVVFRNAIKAFTGCMLAIAVNIFPYPVTSISLSRKCATNIAEKLGETWATAITFYFAPKKNSYKQAELKAEMLDMQLYMTN